MRSALDAVDVGLHVARVEPELLDHDLLAAAGVLRARAAPCGGTDARRELLHRERLDEVVVGADLERVDPVVLGAARRHDDDRSPDPLAACLLDHLPAVEPGQHQIEHADVGPLEAESRQTRLPVRHADCVEAGRLQVARHPLSDDVVVLDDQDLCHALTMMTAARLTRGRAGL